MSVDTAAKTFHYNHDYYLLKHLTHFVEIGARILDATGTCDDVIAFVNPDGKVVLLLRNQLMHSQKLQVQVGNRAFSLDLPPDSFGTLRIGPA